MSANRHLFELRAAPHGQRIGLFLARDGQNSLALVVHPKPWATGGRRKSADFDTSGALSLQLCENEAATVRCGQSEARFLERVIERLALESAPPREQTAPLNGLLSLRRLHPSMDARYPRSRTPTAEDIAVLLQLAALGHPRTLESDSGDASKGDQATPTPADAGGVDDLLLLAQWSLVREIEARVREVRRSYVSVTEPLAVVRGRITSRGWGIHVATEQPSLECAHDHFTSARPLFRVLVTAVELVASGVLFNKIGLAHAGLFSLLRQRASRLRMHLTGIPAYSIGQASSEVGRVRLSRVDRTWARPLALARMVLQREPPSLSAPSGKAVSALLWSIPTDKLWQDILIQALGTDPRLEIQDGNTGAAGPVRPWGDLGSAKRPDLLVCAGSTRLVADAKYKSNGTLSAQDQHQIFTYSHLAQVNGQPPTACMVLRPRVPPLGSSRVSTHHRGGEDGAFPLYIVDLDFPGRADLSTVGWGRYCERSASWLVEELGLALEHPAIPIRCVAEGMALPG